MEKVIKSAITKTLKSRVLAHHKKGRTSNEIRKFIPELTRQQIAAIKAHDTMGTYNK